MGVSRRLRKRFGGAIFSNGHASDGPAASSAPMTYANSLFRLNLAMMQLGAEAAGVMALRTMKLATGGAAATAEAERMVSEKLIAAAEANTRAWADALTGQSHLTAQRTITHYRRKVRANRRRLSA